MAALPDSYTSVGGPICGSTGGPICGSTYCYGNAYSLRNPWNKSLYEQEEEEKNFRKKRKDQRAPYKAECRAQQLIQTFIGIEQWRVYRETNIVAVRGKSIWLIGNVFKHYNKFKPFQDKPDVVRIDRSFRRELFRRILKEINGVPVTYFCVDTLFKDRVPYSDKVFTCVVQCAYDEKKFYKTGNRLGERMLKKMPKCALYEGA